jgi:hypothetical protein
MLATINLENFMCKKEELVHYENTASDKIGKGSLQEHQECYDKALYAGLILVAPLVITWFYIMQ